MKNPRLKPCRSSSSRVLLGLALAVAGLQARALEGTSAASQAWPSASIPKKVPFEIGRMEEAPVITRGEAGAWDHADILHPSVVYFKNQYIAYYSGFDGTTWRTGIASSKDGMSWTKSKGNPVLDQAPADWALGNSLRNGAAVVFNDKVLYCFQGVDARGRRQLGLAISTDGFQFVKHPIPVLSPGAENTWDGAAVSDPFLLVHEGNLYLYFLGEDEQKVQRLGVARSADGLSWERFPGNPILDVGAEGSFDENGLGEPSVIFQKPYYYLFYTGKDVQDSRNLGYAISSDGMHWKKMTGLTGLISENIRFDWCAKQIWDSSLLPMGDGKWLVWFAGLTSSEAGAQQQGQIGMMTFDLSSGYDSSGFDAEINWDKVEQKPSSILLGSHDVEGEMGNRFTWIGPRASVRLNLNPTVVNKELVLEGWAPAELIAKRTKKEGAQTVTLWLNGTQVASRTFVKDDTFELHVPWATIAPLLSDKPSLDVEIRTDRFFVPAQVEDSKDTRELALTLKRIVFRAAPVAAR